MSNPNDRQYRTSHEWLLVKGDQAIVGITDFAQQALGDITFVDLPKVGTILEAGELLGTVESVKAVSDIFVPASGSIIEVNSALESSPELVNQSPYDQGWLVKIQVSSIPGGLLNAADYAKHCESESH